MLDIKFVRENPDIVKQNIKNKFQDEKLPLVDEVIELDGQPAEGQAGRRGPPGQPQRACPSRLACPEGQGQEGAGARPPSTRLEAAEIQAQVTAESEQREQLEKQADELAVQRPGHHDARSPTSSTPPCPSARTTPATWRFSASARPRCPTSTSPTTPTSWSAFDGIDLDQRRPGLRHRLLLPAGRHRPAPRGRAGLRPGLHDRQGLHLLSSPPS